MTREEIEMLGLTIHKRLGKKANALWREAERDLMFIEIIKNHISRELKFDIPKEIKVSPDYSSSWVSYWYEYVSKKVDEEGIIFITEWLKENIDKESLRKWLDEVE